MPSNLLTLVKMILEGPNIEDQANIKDGRNNAAYAICQLLIYSSVKHRSSHANTACYNADRETPLAIYNGLKLHVKSRMRSLVENQHKLGMSISYNRVTQISTDFANSIHVH